MISAIVLAAGESRRMGEANKLLLPFGERTFIAQVVRSVAASAAAEVVVVLGHEAERVRAALAGYDVIFAENERYPEGMTTSIHAGVRAASPGAEGYMICLSDLPLIEPAEFDRLITAFAQSADERRIVVPVFEGQRGNPVLFSSFYRPAILGEAGLMGCKGVVKRNSAHVLEVEMPTDHVLRDVDTPDAYARLQAGLRGEHAV